MALSFDFTCTGEVSGKVDGDCEQIGREKMTEIIGWSHSVLSHRDAASGLPTGKRQHKAFVLTKEIGQDTPLLMNMLVTNENITSWQLRGYRPSKSGEEQHFWTVNLEDASISEIRQEMLNNRHPENMRYLSREHVSFVYRKIEWVHELAGKMCADDWRAPKLA